MTMVLRASSSLNPLFATRFGLAPLQEMVDLIQTAGHEIQLHLHTEWVDEARDGTLPAIDNKRENIREFSQLDQSALIGAGLLAIAICRSQPDRCLSGWQLWAERGNTGGACRKRDRFRYEL